MAKLPSYKRNSIAFVYHYPSGIVRIYGEWKDGKYTTLRWNDNSYLEYVNIITVLIKCLPKDCYYSHYDLDTGELYDITI